MNQTSEKGQISGVSLASFLQILEQESKSCRLIVQQNDEEGVFYFDQGSLIDAEVGKQAGIDAAYTLLSWSAPTFRVDGPEERIQRITLPLAHIILNAATRQDEKQSDGTSTSGQGNMVYIPSSSPGMKNNPGLQRLVDAIFAINEIKQFFLLSRQGKVIVQSSRSNTMADFITYAVVCGIQMRKALDSRGPHRIQLVMDNGEILLVLPGAGMIIGLLLRHDAIASEIVSRLRPSLVAES